MSGVRRKRAWSTAGGALLAVLLATLLGILAIAGEGAYWARSHGYSLDALPKRWAYAVGIYKPWPKLEEAPAGSHDVRQRGQFHAP